MNRIVPVLEKSLLSRDAFRVINLIICLLYFMPSTFNVTNIPMKIAFAWGGIIVLYEVFIKKNFFKMRFSWLLIGAMISFILTIIINRENFLIPSIYNLGYLLITLIVIFPADFSQSEEEKKKKMVYFNNVFIIIIFLAALISIYQFIFLISYHVPTGTPGLLARQGFIEHRLFGVYTSPNVGAMFGYTSIILSLISVLISKITKTIRVFYMMNFIVQIFYITLSSSRGAQVVICSFLVLFLLLFANSKFRKSIREVLPVKIKWMVSILLVLLVYFSFGTNYAKDFLATIPVSIDRKVEVIESNESDKTPLPEKEVILQHSSDNSEISAGRFTIWKAALKVIRPTLLFGYGETDFYGNSDAKFLKKVDLDTTDVNELKRAHGNMHNGFLQVLVSSGIIAFICIYAFYVLNIFSLLKTFFRSKVNYAFLGIVLIFILSIFIDEMVEAHVLFNKRDVISIVFWYYLGSISYLYLKKGELI
ncbi:O-antigen ligase domain-containing protein [Enterococcus faecium]|uniref:O-antigen ligase family protein n=1 Tax=Enterococcus faecium TaxID=1352 RepID=UPI0012E29B6E|nr:O-antigen ligase family protein [Enterococcus faecium]MUO03982.1 O-antigen ligase domain-containing protein [Enterococcus faecium]